MHVEKCGPRRFEFLLRKHVADEHPAVRIEVLDVGFARPRAFQFSLGARHETKSTGLRVLARLPEPAPRLPVLGYARCEVA